MKISHLPDETVPDSAGLRWVIAGTVATRFPGYFRRIFSIAFPLASSSINLSR